MIELPRDLSSKYRPATDREIHHWSFGAVSVVRGPDAESWQPRHRTLNDDAIFGPRRDFECSCGKYRGAKYQRMICDICGVKVDRSAIRRTRFGHIDLHAPVPHPLGEGPAPLQAVPVLPATFWESVAGAPLAELYEDILRTNATSRGERISAAIESVMAHILPIAADADRWNLEEARTLAHGLALIERDVWVRLADGTRH
jgi:hypothetical protein